ncbi:DUF4230 domain-containing protein [Polymorphobacter sp. PAMC 29334]|nr:DUF4230 domain-containing protein [Polymorphobacter sp. PAMC 29334]
MGAGRVKRYAVLWGLIAGLLFSAALVGVFRAPLVAMLLRGPDPVSIADVSLNAVQAQNKLTAFAARFTVAVTSQQTRLGLFHATKTLIVPGTVRYELDWKRVTRRDLDWNAATKTLTVTIPRPAIAGPEIDLTRIREFKDGALLLALTDAEAALDTANRARVQSALLEEAKAPLLVQMASDATRAAVERTFKLPLAAAGLDAAVVVRFP